MKSPLSVELKIACEIYRCNKKDITCTTPYLIKKFELYGIDIKRTQAAIDTLFDWSMLKCEWCNENRTYFIPSGVKSTIKSMYKRYWKEERKYYNVISKDAVDNVKKCFNFKAGSPLAQARG